MTGSDPTRQGPYGWALTNPLRKIYYNLTTTGLSIFIAFVVGSVQLLTVLSPRLGLNRVPPLNALAELNLTAIGVLVVTAFVLTWAGAVTWRRLRRYDDRYPGPAGGSP